VLVISASDKACGPRPANTTNADKACFANGRHYHAHYACFLSLCLADVTYALGCAAFGNVERLATKPIL